MSRVCTAEISCVQSGISIDPGDNYVYVYTGIPDEMRVDKRSHH